MKQFSRTKCSKAQYYQWDVKDATNFTTNIFVIQIIITRIHTANCSETTKKMLMSESSS